MPGKAAMIPTGTISLPVHEIAMVDLSYYILEQRNEPMQYRSLMREIADYKEMDAETVRRFLPQLYTEINIDGRFICVGRGLWGLRDWYPTEQATDSAVAANVKDDCLDEEAEEAVFAEQTDFAEEDPLAGPFSPSPGDEGDASFAEESAKDAEDDEEDDDL